MAAKEKIGFIGLGFMGHGMAKNLLAKGFHVTIMGHSNRTPIDNLVSLGAVEAKTPLEITKTATVIFMCVTGSKEVEAIIRGANGIKAGAFDGLVVIDCSTSNPVSTLELFHELLPLGVTFVDAPLGGTPKQAEAGELTAMVGCDENIYQRIEPIISAWGRAIPMGKIGVGHQMKLLNNFLSMGYGAIYAEALSVAAKAGISPKLFDSVIRGSRMDCGFYQTYFKYVLERDENAHLFTLKNAHKDVSYFAQFAESVQVANPVGAAVKNYYTTALAQGYGGKMVPMLSDVVAENNGTKIGD